MAESIGNLLLCLSIGMMVGVMVGWYISDMMRTKENAVEFAILKKGQNEKESIIVQLKDEYARQKQHLDKLTDEGIVCRHQLLQKSNKLTKKADELFKVQEKLKEVEAITKEREMLERKVNELNILLVEKEQTLYTTEGHTMQNETEAVEVDLLQREPIVTLLKERDFKLHEFQVETDKLKMILNEKEQLIRKLNEKINESQINNQGWDTLQKDHILISRDQLKEIEKRIAEYKKRAEMVETERFHINANEIRPSQNVLGVQMSRLKNLFIASGKNFKNSYQKTTKA